MNIINLKVKHKKFGDGIITTCDGKYLTVNFGCEEIKFVYPDAIGMGLLQIYDQDVYANVLQEWELKKVEIERQEQQRKLEMKRQREERILHEIEKRRKAKRIERKNVAFKCTYCDGGLNEKSIGFSGPCSQCNMDYNVNIAKHVWCSLSRCNDFLQNKATYEDVLGLYQNRQLCYESTMLERWVAGAGITQTGKNKGMPMKLEKVQINSLAVLTTRLPNEDESKRIIFAVFLVNEAYEGDNREEGYVTTTSKWKISLKPDEAKQILFWDYYYCENAPHVIRFGSGLHRYLSDVQAAQILQDIVRVKSDAQEKAFAQEFLGEFCGRVGLKLNEIDKKNGALIKIKDNE